MRTVGFALVLSFTSTVAFAQEEGDDETVAPETAEPAMPPVDEVEQGRLTDEQAMTEERYGVEREDDTMNPFEDPQKRYYFLGLFYRQVVVPAFLIEPFMANATGASNPGFGAEFLMRKSGFTIGGQFWWVGAGFNGPFRSSGDPIGDTEILDSSLSAIYASASFMWSTTFGDMFAFEYGVDVGLGVLLGDLVRTEAYRDANGNWQPCIAFDNPPGSQRDNQCGFGSVPDGEEGEHYGVKARRLFEGGSVPNIVPWVGLPHLALRFKPIRQFESRLDIGYGVFNFFFGLSAAYGF